MATHRDILVTGCGRSGTLFFARTLRKLGLDVGHEEDGADGVVSCYHGAPGPYPEDPGRKRNGIDEVIAPRTLVLVREPLHVIASTMKIFRKRDWDWIEAELSKPWTLHHGLAGTFPKVRRSPLLRSACYWSAWTFHMIRHEDSMLLRVEDTERRWREITKFLELPIRPYPNVPTTTNRSTGFMRALPLEWEDLESADPLIYETVRGDSRMYGYG